MIDREEIKGILWSLALADHMGDVNDDLPRLCAALSLPAPTWSDGRNRLVMAWETSE